MDKKIEAKVLAEVHPFTPEEEKRLEEKPIEDIRPYLDALTKWRAESFYAPIVIC